MKYNFDLDLIYNNSLALIAKQIKRNSMILEFGPANGRLTKYMKEQLSCDVYLVEIDRQAGLEAASYGKDIVFGDIEEYEWCRKFDGLKFDFILFADVLEHLREPEKVLIKAKLFLKPEGSILLSVPNIAHNSVLINLMNNIFSYTSIGLLDNTHIHFFTKYTLDEMMFKVGLEPVKKMGTYNEVGNNEISNSYNDVRGLDEAFWKGREYGEVYQFVYEVKNGQEYAVQRDNALKKYYKPYFMQCYFDTGEGFHEENSITRTLTEMEGSREFEISIAEPIVKFRIDPVNKECVLENYSCKVWDGQAWITLCYWKSNADAIECGQYYFFNRDPQFVYDIQGMNVQRIKVEMQIVTLDVSKINLMYDTLLKAKRTYLSS